MAESFGGIGVFSAFSTPLLEVLHAELCSLKFFFSSKFIFLFATVPVVQSEGGHVVVCIGISLHMVFTT